jgi:DNA-binding CsgD family transcriptional regulator/PAS domain-containing protein
MSELVSSTALSTVIGGIYDCVLEPDRWETALIDISRLIDMQNSSISLTDTASNQFLIYRTVGIAPHYLEVQKKHVPEAHAELVRYLSTGPSLDVPHVMSREVPAERWPASPYYQECLKPQGIVDIAQYFLMVTRTRIAGYGFARNERQGAVTEREIEIGCLLLPHIRRAVMISDVLDVRTIEKTRMEETLEALHCGVILTNGRGQILHANASGEELLRDGNIIKSTAGTLRAVADRPAMELREAISTAASDEAAIGKTGLAVPLNEYGRLPLFAHVLPLGGSELRTRLQPEAVAAIFIAGDPDEQNAAKLIATTFGLTPAETRLLAGLLGGQTLTDTAISLGITLQTAKTHLKNIFSKTGATRQGDLLQLGARVASPTRSPEDG